MQNLRNALGQLQDDPDNEQAYDSLKNAVGNGEVEGTSKSDARRLIESARRAHQARREYDAVASLLELEVLLAQGTDAEGPLLLELARIADEELLDDERASLMYERLLSLGTNDPIASEALENSEAKRTKWNDLVTRYVDEASRTEEPAFKSSLLVSAADTAYRFGKPELLKSSEKGAKKRLAGLLNDVVQQLGEALQIDPKNRRASTILERIYRDTKKYEDLTKVLERMGDTAPTKEERTASFIRLARVLSKKLGSPERAMAAYERVLDLSPGHPEAISALVDFFTQKEMWDHLVSLYEETIATTQRLGQPLDIGAILQIAMVNWKMRGKPDAAEPYMEKLRKAEPAHPGMLAFFREVLASKNDVARLQQILTDASRSLPDGTQRAQIVAEIAKLSEEGANAQKAIEQWRAVLRQDSANKDARDALKRLYRSSGQFNALADLLRSELEKLKADDAEGRLPLLRDIAQLYQDHVKNDSALVAVLTQMSQLDPNDADVMRQLVRVYDLLGRSRDLLAAQSRLGELEQEPSARGEIYRQVARRWLEQFSNVQNAMEAYEALAQALPADEEANTKLKELYVKRRAYKPLYELLEREAGRLGEGQERRDAWIEMAKLAAERLDRGADAVRLYKQVLEEDPGAAAALDALEKQAERDKDFPTVAQVLERRAEAAPDPVSKLAVLQKLGAIYSDRLQDHASTLRTWKRVLELSPGHAKALRVLRDSYLAAGDYDGLATLYEGNSDWEGLAEVLSNAADKATDTTAKVELSFRAADVYTHKLEAPERAFRAYERVLAARPGDKRAAEALVPLYEKEEKWPRLPALYEALLGHAEEPADKVEILNKLAQLTGDKLQDKNAAFGYQRRAYETLPDEETLKRFEAAAMASGQWEPFVKALEARLTEKKVRDKRVLQAKVAEVYATQLGRVEESVATYRQLVEDDENDEVAVQTLDRILRAADRRDDIRWLYDLRVGRANTAQKVDLLSEWAALEEEVFGSSEQAATLYRRVLELVPQHGRALRALSRLLQSSGDPNEAVAMLERDRDQREGKERASCEVELAQLYFSKLNKPSDALEAVKRALELDQAEPGAMGVLEALMNVSETRAKAAILLEEHYAHVGNLAKEAEVLEVRIATAASKTDRVPLFAKLVGVHEQMGAFETAFDVAVRACDEFPSDLPAWDKLAELAGRTGRMSQLVETLVRAVPAEGDTGLATAVEIDLSERIATIFDEQLGEMDRARPYLDRILLRDPSNERAFARLKQILTSLERWQDLDAFYERAVQGASDPSRQADLLAEVALIAEEITGERGKAIAYYERILTLEAAHEQATRALDILYPAEQMWDRLAALLARRLENAGGDEATLRLRLGALYAQKLSDWTHALDQVEPVLTNDTGNREARELAESALGVPGQRARAAAMLENVYVTQEQPRDLVRILEVRLENAGGDDKVELLRRIADLRDEKLHEDVAALDTYAKLVPLSPDDEHARTRLMDIARRVGSHAQAAEVMTAAAANARAPQPRGDILTAVAKIYEDFLDDTTKAEGVYREVLEIDPNDATLALPTARALERIYTASGRKAELAQILRIEVKLEDDAETRKQIHGRLGEICETALDDLPGAIAAWRARLDDDAADEVALESLDRLYERTNDAKALVEVLRARERAATDGHVRKTLMLRLATTLGDKLNDVQEAILAYRAVTDEFGPERSVLSALVKLYEAAERNEDLAETLEAELGMAETNDDKLTLLAKLGQVKQLKLKDVNGALETYRQALTLDPAHPASRTALESLLDDADVKRDAASVLRPLYEAEGEQRKLLRVLDIEADNADSVSDKLGVLSQAVMVSEQSLNEPSRAFDYAARALKDAAGEPELTSWLDRAERLAASSSRQADFVALLKAVAPDVLDEQMQLDVLLKVADLARSNLNDPALAREYYEKALALRADDRRALEALEALYADSADNSALLDVLKRRAESGDNDTERKAFLFKQAKLSDETLKDARGAISTYEQILELGLDADAVAALVRLYTESERWDDLVALYERQIAEVTSEREKANHHHQLGQVFELRMKDFDRAFDEYTAALKIDADHKATVAALEALMKGEDKAHGARAAEMLEPAYLARLDWRNVMATLDARLRASEDPDERRTLLRRLAKLYEEQEENYAEALETTAKLLTEDVTDETTWSELERLARVANAGKRLAEIYAIELEKITSDEPATAKLARRCGELFEEQGDTERALSFYRRAYAFAPEESVGVFDAIDKLLRTMNRAKDRVTLYRDALEYRNDTQERLTTLHMIASLEETELKDDDAAIDTFRAALDIDETDNHSLEALAKLYARRERWKDLGELARTRAEQAALPEDEARFRLELGQLLQTKLNEAGQAIDEYQMVVDIVPVGSGSATAAAAVKALESLIDIAEHKQRVIDILRPLYERADDWKQLVAVNEDRFEIASDTSEKVAILRETAQLWEERGGDPMKAFDAIRAAFILDPEDGESRSQLDRLGEATKRWDELADTYEKAMEKTEDLTKRELLSALAKLHDQKRDDPRRALEAYERLSKLDENELEPFEQMDLLANLLSDWPMLVRVLEKKAELLSGDDERASTWRRVGEAKRDMLEDEGGAIIAYERALELEPDSAWTVDSLIPLYEAKNDAAKLVDLYRKRIDLCTDDEQDKKYELLMSAANRYEADLNDRREAINLLTDALAVKPSDPDVSARLGKLYEAESMWPELLDNLRLQAAAADDASRRTIKRRIGDLLAKHMEDAPQALEAYREVLDGNFDEEAVKAIRQIGETHEDLRIEAANAVEPVLRTAQRYADVADVLELRLRAETEPPDRARTLRAIAEVAETNLSDPKRAEDALLRALAEEPGDAALHTDIARIAGTLGEEGWARYADALFERASAIFDAPVATDLYMRLGKVCEGQLHDEGRAAKAYSSAMEQSGDSTDVLEALDGLYSRLGDTKKLAEILERRVVLEPEAQTQAQLFFRLATLQIKEFADAAQGLGTLRQALDRVPEHAESLQAVTALLDGDLFQEAFDVLENAYRTLSRNDDLAALWERKVARAKDARERTRARLDLARVLDENAKDPARAQRVVEQAMIDDPQDSDVLSEIERLAPVTGGWREAGDALAQALIKAEGVPNPVKSELWVRLAGWRRDKLTDARGAEEAFAEARKLEPENLDILRALEDLQRAPGRERDLVDTLRARAKIDADLTAKKELLKEAKALAEGTVGDATLAEEVLNDLLAEDDGDLWALEELTRLREQANAWEDVVKLLTRRAELEAEGSQISQLRHRAAGVLRDNLKSAARAIKLYEDLFENDPNDTVASDALRTLYETEKRHKDLAMLLERLTEIADSEDARTKLRLELAKLKGEMGNADEAIEALRAVLDENPQNADAVVMLSEILEKEGKDDELAELLNTQIEQAKDRGDRDAELAFQVRLGEVFEGRLKDTTKALATYESVLERDAAHKGALEAVARLSEGRENWERAAAALSALLGTTTEGPDGIALALRLAKARGELKDQDGVQEALSKALSFDAKNAEVRDQLRELYEKTKKWPELAAMLTEDANFLEDGGDKQPATIASIVKLLRRASEIHIKERNAAGEAVPLLERASVLVPQDRELLLLLCDAYTASGREKSAAEALEKVIASFGGKRTKELAVYHHKLGKALSALGEKATALAQLEMGFKVDPGNVIVMRDLGALALESGDLEKATKMFRALLLQKLDPATGISKGDVFFFLGEVSAKQGDKTKAIQMFERALENDPNLKMAKIRIGELKGA